MAAKSSSFVSKYRLLDGLKKKFTRLQSSACGFDCKEDDVGARPTSRKVQLCEYFKNKNIRRGSGCGSVGRAVDSDTRGLWFESSHQQNFIYIEHLFTVNCVLKRLK